MSPLKTLKLTGHAGTAVLALATVYLVWGSSFLVTSIGVHQLPPRLFSGIRFTLSGLLLLTVARLTGRRMQLGARELRHVLVMSFCSIFVSNGLNNWAMQWVPSNQTALLNASTSLWTAGLGTIGPRAHPLSVRVLAGLALGLAGVALILLPGGSLPAARLWWPELGILLGCLSWSTGTIYFRSVGTELDILSFIGTQMLLGGLMLVALGVGCGDLARWTWSVRGLAAMAYLTLFSSCIAYVAYAWLARHVPPAQAGSHGYVNPAVAALLGWLVLNETLSRSQVIGMVVILGGIVLVSWPTRLAGLRPKG